jgi:hypothetical protein
MAVLIDPDGGEVTVENAAAVNNLVYGHGYRIQDEGAESDTRAADESADEPAAAPAEPARGSNADDDAAPKKTTKQT